MSDIDISKSLEKHYLGKHYTGKDFVNPNNERLYDAYLFGCDARDEELNENINPYGIFDWRHDAWLCGFKSKP